MSMYRRDILWTFVGNWATVAGVNMTASTTYERWFGPNNTLIDDTTTVPTTAYFVVPCERAKYMNLAFSLTVTGAVTGNRLITTCNLKGSAQGLPFRNVLDTNKWIAPVATRSSLALANAQRENCALDFVVNDTAGANIRGVQEDHTAAAATHEMVVNAAFIGDGTAIVAADACDWWISVGRRLVNPSSANLAAASLTAIPEPTINGMACVWVALKTVIVVAAGGTTDYSNIPVDAELSATVWS